MIEIAYAVLAFAMLVIMPFYLSHRAKGLNARIDKQRERRRTDGLAGENRTGV